MSIDTSGGATPSSAAPMEEIAEGGLSPARKPAHPTIADIQRATCKYYSVSKEELLAKHRGRRIVRPRHIAMYLCMTMTVRGTREIGRRFQRTHTTVMYAFHQVEALLLTEPAVAEAVKALEEAIAAAA